MSNETPRWVQEEIWNWSRWCWLGDWPHPLPPRTCASGERAFPSGIDRDEEDEAPPLAVIPVSHERAVRVERAYQRLSLAERRAVQAEYTRRHEYGEMPAHQREAAASRQIGISTAHYRGAIAAFRQAVMKEFAG